MSYRVAWTGKAWLLKTIAVCPAKQFERTCAHSIEYKRHLYRLEAPQPAGVVYGVALPPGFGWALGCASDPVGPIDVYGASEESTKLAITSYWNGVVHMYPASNTRS